MMDGYIVAGKREQARLIATVVASVLMFSLDFSMLNISLPNIAQYFRVNVGVVARLPMAYLLIVTSSLLGFGKLGDIRGYKRVFIAGVLFFIAGIAVATVSRNINMLLVARILQSAGEAMFSPVGIAMLTTFLPDSIKGKALGIVALAQGMGFAIGNFAGSYITSHFSWRAIFIINVPIAALILLGARFLPTRQPESSDRRFDTKGSILIFTALATMLYAVSSLQKVKVANQAIPWCFDVSIIAFAFFIAQERRIDYPILDFKFFKNIDFTFANISAFFVMAILMGFTFMAPFYFELVKKFNIMQTGMLLMIPSATMMFTAPFAGRVSDSIGSRIPCIIGAFLEMSAFMMFTFFNANTPLPPIALALLMLGVAVGIFLAPNNRLVMMQAPCDKQGVASGVYKIFLNTGSVFGIAVIPIVIIRSAVSAAGRSNIVLSELKNMPGVLESSFRGAFIFGIIVSALAIFFAFLAQDAKRDGKEAPVA